MAKYDDGLMAVARVGLSLADPGRLRLLLALRGQSLCVCQLTELLGLAPSTVSKHLSVLKDAGLVVQRKTGRWVFYELCSCECSCQGVLQWLQGELARDGQVKADRESLKKILKTEPEELCRRQCKRSSR